MPPELENMVKTRRPSQLPIPRVSKRAVDQEAIIDFLGNKGKKKTKS